MSEIWKDVKGYEDLYQISNEGRLRSLDKMVLCRNGHRRKVPGRILKPRILSNGYIQYMLSEDGIKKYFYAHRLVAIAFIPNGEGLPEINHRNEIKTDNRVENLEWCNSSYNNRYGTKIERQNTNTNRDYTKNNMRKVNQYALDGQLIAQYEGIRIASKVTGIPEQSISKCCRKIMHQTHGFKWGYV